LYIAKFSRAFDEPALSSCSFFASCSLIAKAVDFSARQVGFNSAAFLVDVGFHTIISAFPTAPLRSITSSAQSLVIRGVRQHEPRMLLE
jgi:hypothetical protein